MVQLDLFRSVCSAGTHTLKTDASVLTYATVVCPHTPRATSVSHLHQTTSNSVASSVGVGYLKRTAGVAEMLASYLMKMDNTLFFLNVKKGPLSI